MYETTAISSKRLYAQTSSACTVDLLLNNGPHCFPNVGIEKLILTTGVFSSLPFSLTHGESRAYLCYIFRGEGDLGPLYT